MKKFLAVALSVTLAIGAVLSLLIEPARADIVQNTRLRVLPASEIRGGHFKVFYGPLHQYISGGLMDVTEQMASEDGLVYRPIEVGAENYDIFIEADPNYVITAARIVMGSVEQYSRGQFIDETDTIELDTPRKVLRITAEQMSYTDGEGAAHIEEGGSAVSNIPKFYTGPAYYSKQDDQTGLHFFTIEVETEMENSGAFLVEETSTGTLLRAQYTINVSGYTWTGTAREVNDQFALATIRGDVKHGDQVEVFYDTSKVGFILVQKGSKGYDDPKAPDWIEKEGSIAFTLDEENRAMRFMYNAPPGSVKLVEGANPLQFTTKVEVSRYKDPVTKEIESFSGDIGAVNDKLEEWLSTLTVWNGDEIFFRLLSPEHVDTVSTASKRVNHGREENMSPFSGNVLEGAGWPLTLTNTHAYEFKINYHTLPGKVFIDETAPNQGTFGFTAKSGPIKVVQKDDTAAKACAEMNADIERKVILLDATITITFPENISSVRMAVGTNPSHDITGLLVNRTYTYTETVEDVHFFVVYKNAGGEIIINPTVPIDPDVPPYDPSIFGGGDTGTIWPDPGSGNIPGPDWIPPVGGTGCTCPWCSWVTSTYPAFSSGIPTKPEWSVLLSVSSKDTNDAGDEYTTVLAADDVYAFTADTDVRVTITPVGNHPVNVKLSYTVDGKTHDFTVSESTGEISATVIGQVTIDVEMGKTGFAAEMPTAYAVHLPEPEEGTAIRDHNTALPGDTVTIAVMPNSGKTVNQVQVITANGKSVSVQYLGHSTKGYAIYTFTMPEDAVFISMTFTGA